MSNLEMMSFEQYKITKTCDFAFGKIWFFKKLNLTFSFSGEEKIFHERVALAMTKGNPWIGYFNEYIELFSKTGLVTKWKKVRKKNIIFITAFRRGAKCHSFGAQ